MVPRLVRYSIAVPNERVQYRASLYPPDQSIYFGRKVTCRSPEAQRFRIAVVVLAMIE
jgi:hypothetical protein